MTFTVLDARCRWLVPRKVREIIDHSIENGVYIEELIIGRRSDNGIAEGV